MRVHSQSDYLNHKENNIAWFDYIAIIFQQWPKEAYTSARAWTLFALLHQYSLNSPLYRVRAFHFLYFIDQIDFLEHREL